MLLISVSASFPHGSGHQDTEPAHYGDIFKHQHANSNVLCNRLRRYIDTMLRNSAVHCNGSEWQEASEEEREGDEGRESPSFKEWMCGEARQHGGTEVSLISSKLVTPPASVSASPCPTRLGASTARANCSVARPRVMTPSSTSLALSKGTQSSFGI